MSTLQLELIVEGHQVHHLPINTPGFIWLRNTGSSPIDIQFALSGLRIYLGPWDSHQEPLPVVAPVRRSRKDWRPADRTNDTLELLTHAQRQSRLQVIYQKRALAPNFT